MKETIPSNNSCNAYTRLRLVNTLNEMRKKNEPS